MNAAAPEQKPAARHRIDLRQARILVADDNSQALAIMSQVLLGFCVRHVTVCRSVDEALPLIEKSPFDLLIIDAEMPGKDGFDLTHYVRLNPRSPNFTVPILLMSGLTPLNKITKARDSGANLVLLKPVVPGALLGRIEWLARCQREFVISDSYRGPDRRFQRGAPPPGVDERRAEDIRLLSQPERAMSQNEIDSIFG